MTLDEALHYIHSVCWKGSVPGLERISALLDKMGHPERKLKFIHVTGTNGKGSTCAMLASMFTKAGYKTGLYTSPYLIRFNERIQIDGVQIPDEEICEITEYIKPLADSIFEQPTEFEMVTALGFEYFARHNCDLVVCEVGMGGEFDATNVILPPEVAIICNIGLDHTEVLGDTLEKIAATKSGIIKPGCDAVIYREAPSVEAVIEARCKEVGAKLHKADFADIRLISHDLTGQVFDWERFHALKLPLLGNHQLHNAAVALTAATVMQQRGWKLTDDDIREGLTAVVSVKLVDPQFEGQTKTRLGNTEAKPAVEFVMNEFLTPFLEDLKNSETASLMADKAIKAAKVRESARKAKSMAREKNKLDNAPLVGKLSSCTGRDYKINELFIVEGDSAGGSAKQGRDRRFQAILPLRGKPLNVEKKRIDQVLQNEEFRSIITAIGTGIGEDFDISGLKYDKIIILSDADQDGAHIRAILLTFFYRYMKELITEGHVYMGQPPLYKLQKGTNVQYLYDDAALNKALKAIGKGYSLQRYKGLGEMNPEQLWDTTMNPENRTLVRVNIEDTADVEHLVTLLMGDKVGPRKEYISEYANFNKTDAFEEKAEKAQRINAEGSAKVNG